MELQSTYIDNLIVKYLDNTISKDDKEDLSLWLSKSKENRAYFIQQIKIWEISMIELQSEDESRKFYKQFLIKTSKIKHRFKHLFRIAAAVVFCVVSVQLLQFVLQSNKLKTLSTDLLVQKIILPDSTMVWLNTNSSLTYSENFDRKRTVDLQGEAYFDVVKNKSKSFKVNTSNLTIEVLGTSFVVIDREGVDEVETVLEKGSIHIKTNKTGDEAYMLPNQKNTYNKSTNTSQISEVNPKDYIQWFQESVIFENTPFCVVLDKLSLRFGIEIECLNKALYKTPITFKVDSEDLYEILEVLQHICRFEWEEIDKNKITIH